MQPHTSLKLLATATVQEAGFLLKHWKGNSKARWTTRPDYLFYLEPGASAALVVTGIGPEKAKKGLETAIDELGNIGAFVGFGLAGGLIKTAQKGDLVIPTSIQWGQETETPTEWLRMSLASNAGAVAWRKSITVEKVVSSPVEKAALYAATDAEAVDMESGAWGAVCKARGIPWAVVRTVLDPADEALAGELAQAVDAFGRVRWGSALSFFFSHPKLIPAAAKLSPARLRKLSAPHLKVLSGWLSGERARAA